MTAAYTRRLRGTRSTRRVWVFPEPHRLDGGTMDTEGTVASYVGSGSKALSLP